MFKNKYITSFLIAVLMIMTTPASRADQALDATEMAIIDWSNSHTEEAIDLLEKLVNINSGSLNIQGVKEVGDVLRSELEDLAFETRWVDQPEYMERGGHLFGSHEGRQGKKILLIGHLDTVYEPEEAFQTFVRDGSNATGPGVSDMKGGDVVMIYALKALRHAGVLDDIHVMVAFTGDEELAGKPTSVSRKDLIEAGQWADVALGFEGGIGYDGKDWATISRRSSSSWCLEVTGKQAHSAGVFSERTGAGAIFEATRILNAFYNELRGEEYLTFNAGTIVGGTEVDGHCKSAEGRAFGKTNVVPNRTIVRGDIRTISDQQLQDTREKMKAVVARNLPVTSASISFVDSYPAMAPTEGNRQLRDMLSDINVDIGRGEMSTLSATRRGAADISFVAPYTDGLAGMGVYGTGAHTPDESVDLASIPIAVQRAAILMYRLSR